MWQRVGIDRFTTDPFRDLVAFSSEAAHRKRDKDNLALLSCWHRTEATLKKTP